MNVLFRCDADPGMGTGHARRCLTLADALAGAGVRCVFAGRFQVADLARDIERKGHALLALGAASDQKSADALALPRSGDDYASWLPWSWEEDARMCRALLADRRMDWLVVDHYALDARWERSMRGVSTRILAIDDLANRPHDCDVLLDANFGRGPGDYAGLVSPSSTLLLGSRHVLLRPEFVRVRRAGRGRHRPGPPRRLLINMGGSDPVNATGSALRTLRSLDAAGHVDVTAVLGAGAPWMDDVATLVDAMPMPSRLVVNAPDMADLMAESDLAIGSGGTGVYERLYLRLPSLVTPIADNQRQHLAMMATAGLFQLYEDQAGLRASLGEAFAEGLPTPPDVVGNGVAITCRAMSLGGLLLLPPDGHDIRRTFRWLRDPGLRRDFLLDAMPLRAGHVAYWRRLLADPGQRVFAVHADGRHVGNAGIRRLRPDEATAELWLYLGDPADRGHGYGRRTVEALESAMRAMGMRRSDLHVDPGNSVASAMYERLGYRIVPRDPQGPDFAPHVQRMEKAL